MDASRVKSYENVSRIAGTAGGTKSGRRRRRSGKEEKIKPCNEIRSDLKERPRLMKV